MRERDFFWGEMKHERGKKFKKILKFYQINFNLHTPYKIVCEYFRVIWLVVIWD